MSTHHEVCTWEIELLTPLHIGDGEELKNNLDYIGEKDTLKVIDLEAMINQLRDNPKAISEIGRQGFSLDRFVKDYKIPLQVLYTLPFQGKMPQSLRSVIKNAYGHPYIAGSALKGAIRTALWTYLDRSRLPSPSDYWRFENAVKRLAGDDPHHDFLRPLQISDSHGIVSDDILNAQEIKFFNVRYDNQPGWKSFEGRGNPTKERHEEAIGIHVETLKAGQVLHVHVSLDQLLRELPISSIFKIPCLQQLDNFNLLAQAVNEHSLNIAKAEIEFFSQFGSAALKSIDFYKDIISSIEKLSVKPKSFIVRLSWSSGWRGMTGNWLKGNDLETVRSQKPLGKRGQSIFPKTRRLAMKDGFPYIPLGWVMVKPAPKETFFAKAFDSAGLAAIKTKQTEDTQFQAKSCKPLPRPVPTVPKPEPLKEIWEKATIKWTPGNNELIASVSNKKASANRAKVEVPGQYHKKLFEKRESITANIEVEPIGNAFRIAAII